MIELLKKLINIPSVTPDDNGTQTIIKDFLSPLGFSMSEVNVPPVSNLWARIGDTSPLFVFAGHTDVVHEGDKNTWHTPPFEATIKNNVLYGRGACDMKGSLAAMLFSVKHFLEKNDTFNGSIGFLITSGEEGDQCELGTPKVMEFLTKNKNTIDYCLVGEPSSTETVGDVIKIGRRGSLTGNITITGKQGHVAYPTLAQNPIHLITPALQALCEKQYDKGNDFFPPTTFQISNIQSGTGAGNVIPGKLTFKCNFRFSTEVTHKDLIKDVEDILKTECVLPFKIDWRLNGNPFLTEKGTLIKACQSAIKQHTGIDTKLSTTGGTSDGRYIAPFGVEVVELGPVNATIHQVNECVDLNELNNLANVYESVLDAILL